MTHEEAAELAVRTDVIDKLVEMYNERLEADRQASEARANMLLTPSIQQSYGDRSALYFARYMAACDIAQIALGMDYNDLWGEIQGRRGARNMVPMPSNGNL